MSVVHDLQQLVARSKLFATEDKLEEIKIRKSKAKRRGKQGREAVKVGQGGTLDPLADGVLGARFVLVMLGVVLTRRSHRRR